MALLPSLPFIRWRVVPVLSRAIGAWGCWTRYMGTSRLVAHGADPHQRLSTLVSCHGRWCRGGLDVTLSRALGMCVTWPAFRDRVRGDRDRVARKVSNPNSCPCHTRLSSNGACLCASWDRVPDGVTEVPFEFIVQGIGGKVRGRVADTRGHRMVTAGG